MRTGERKQGFTLLEIVVSITILALMALMIARIFSESERAVQEGDAGITLDETARVVLDYIERDLSQALIRTNVAFRVHETNEDLDDSLYFLTTGARRQLEGIRRDTAPISLIPLENGRWNKQVIIEAPYGSSDSENSNVKKLIRHSDYYFSAPDQTADDFQTIHFPSRPSMSISAIETTDETNENLAEHGMLTSLRVVVNGDPDWNDGGNDGQFDPEQPPRFVDITIGLAPASVIASATRLFAEGNPVSGVKLINRHERLYSRRVYLINQGTHVLDL